MKLESVYAVLDGFAPKALSDEYCAAYGAYDNSGVLVDTGEEIDRILFSLDFSRGALDAAREAGARLIVTHHPAIYGSISNLLVGDPLGSKLLACAASGISVVSMHLNLDCAPGGIDESLMRALGGADPVLMHPLSSGGYGRVYAVPRRSLSAFAAESGAALHTERIRVYGTREVSRVASFCGAGADAAAIDFAIRAGADTVVSADWKHHLTALCLERGCNVVDLTHAASEQPGFFNYYKKCRAALAAACLWHADGLE